MTRHVLEIDDLTAAELSRVLELSELPVEALGRPLAGCGAALLFEKPSVRTRHATEMAVVQLGGHPVTTRGDEVGLDVRESVEDVTRTLQGYHAVICARVFEHRKIERMASVATVPVVNLLSDDAHPLQAIADLLTIRQHFGALDSAQIAWVGDFTNVARSLALGAAMSGASFRCATPPGFGPAAHDLDRVKALGGSIVVFDRPADAVAGADCVTTDAWYSMGQESQKDERRRAFEGFQVDSALMEAAGERAVFLHCLPAHRGDEVTDDVIDGPRSLVFPQAHNRMHTARGLLAFLLHAQQVGS
jgi:ornithine carbamoyltransferase